ncbi:MAG: type II methionyl aminopeptidase [archaeon]
MTELSKEDIADYRKAGKILRTVREEYKKKIKVGDSLLSIAEGIESRIKALKAEPAFPCNLSLNNNAAHCTPSINDETVITKNDLIKVDLGCHVEGCIADTAFTLDFSGKWSDLKKASENALNKAVKIIKAGTPLSEIGKTIQNTIEDSGFKVIENLSGHTIKKLIVHASPSIPNMNTSDPRVLEENTIIAIEPFASTGSGHVREGNTVEIYALDEPKPVRRKEAREILAKASGYLTLPFAERWIAKDYKEFTRKVALRELIQSKCFQTYPILRDIEDSIVSQAETTLMLTNKKVFNLLELEE